MTTIKNLSVQVDVRVVCPIRKFGYPIRGQVVPTSCLRIFHVVKTLALSTLLSGVFAVDGFAQSGSKDPGFGSATLRGLQIRNSASRFSVQNIQNRIRNQAVPAIGTLGVNRRNFLGNSSSQGSKQPKPFSGISQGPTVSPYLALSAPRASASDYYNIIRPQQQKQSENRRQQAFSIQRQRQLNQMAARAPYSATGDENSAPTGHAAVFQSLGSYQNTGGYFPPPSAPKGRQR